MPRESQFTDAIEAFFHQHGTATVSEFQQAVGMSRQAAYQWRDRNRYRLNPAGTRAGTGAEVFELLGVTPGTVAPANFLDGGRWVSATATPAEHHELTIGQTLTVQGIRIVGARLVVDMKIDGTGRGKRDTDAEVLEVTLG